QSSNHFFIFRTLTPFFHIQHISTYIFTTFFNSFFTVPLKEVAANQIFTPTLFNNTTTTHIYSFVKTQKRKLTFPPLLC
ncbi:hypothetical protein VIGAN_01230600, partial [Vigna angularis var. angularis]